MAKKKTFKPRNPFIYEGYEGNDYFCDRAYFAYFRLFKAGK